MRLLAYCLMPTTSFGRLAAARWRLERLHDVALDRSRTALPPALPLQRHVWQGRFRAFAIQEDEHLLSVLRYIERNPLRACLVERAQDWLWSSAAEQMRWQTAAGSGSCVAPAGWLQ